MTAVWELGLTALTVGSSMAHVAMSELQHNAPEL